MSDDSPKGAFKAICTIIDFLGLAFVLPAGEMVTQGKYKEALFWIIVGAMFPFLGEVALPKIRLRFNKKKSTIKVEFIEPTMGFITCLVANSGNGEERVKDVRFSIVHESGKIETIGIYIKRRCEALPHIMPPKSSFEVAFKTSVNGMISYNWSQEKWPENKIREYFVTVDFEVGESINSETKVVSMPENLSFSVDFLPSKNPEAVGVYVKVCNLSDNKPLKIHALRIVGIWQDKEESIMDRAGLFQDDIEPPCEIATQDRRLFLFSFAESTIWFMDASLIGYCAEIELRDGRKFRTDIVKKPTPPSLAPDMSGTLPPPT